jgi:hypothetical protein
MEPSVPGVCIYSGFVPSFRNAFESPKQPGQLISVSTAITRWRMMSSRLDFARIADWFVDFRRAVSNRDAISISEFSRWLSNRIDSIRYDKHDVCSACLVSLPEASVCADPSYPSSLQFAVHVSECLSCTEIRCKGPEIICQAYRTADRVFHIHIPKNGGAGIRDPLIRCRQTPVRRYSFEDAKAIERQKAGYILNLIGRGREQSSREVIFYSPSTTRLGFDQKSP